MSSSTYLEIGVSSTRLSRIDFVKSLLKDGWNFGPQGRVEFLPLGDHEDYDWKLETMDHVQLFEIMNKKELNNEILGVAMEWKSSGSGVNLLINEDNRLVFSISINKRYIPETDGIVDANWYLTKIIPSISAVSRIESVNWEHIP